jgi:hypothetical protein
MSTSKKSGLGCLPILAVVAVAAGGLYYFRGNLIGKTLTPLEAAQVIPQEAYATSFISTDSQDWSQLSKFGTPEAQKTISENLEKIKQDLASDSVNYEQDIQPWIGGIMLAFLPSADASEPEMLMVAGIKNKFKARDFEKKLKSQPEQTLQETKYKGIAITEATSKNGNSYSFAVTGSYLLLSDNIETIKNAIDTVKGEASYAKKPGAKEIFSQRLSLKHPVAIVYLADYAGLMQQALNSSAGASIPAQTLEQLQQVKSMIIGMGLEDQGLHFQAIAKLNPDANQLELKSSPGKVLSLYPTETFAVISGQGINQGWKTVVSQSEKNAELKNAVEQIRATFGMINLDADKDVFGWMDGEYALGMLFSNQSTIPNVGIGGMIVLETSDRKTAENTLNSIGKVIQYQGISTKQNGDNTEWTSPSDELLLSYGWLNNNALTMTVFLPFSVAKDVKNGSSLAESANFKAITNILPKNNLGYFYVDLDQAANEITKIAQAQGITPDSNVMTVLDSMQGFAVTLTMPNQTTSQFDMLLALKSSK